MERVQPAEWLSTSPRKRLLERHRSSSATYKVALYVPKLANTRFQAKQELKGGGWEVMRKLSLGVSAAITH